MAALSVAELRGKGSVAERAFALDGLDGMPAVSAQSQDEPRD